MDNVTLLKIVFFAILFFEFFAIAIAVILNIVSQLSNLFIKISQDKKDSLDIYSTEYARIFELSFAFISFNLIIFFLFFKYPLDYYLTVAPPLIGCGAICKLKEHIKWLKEKFIYKVTIKESYGSNCLSKFIESREFLIEKIGSNDAKTIKDINEYVKNFNEYNNRFKIIELIGLIKAAKISDDEYRTGDRCENQELLFILIKNLQKESPICQAEVLKLIIIEKLPGENLLSLFKKIYTSVIDRSDEIAIEKRIELVNKYCDCIEMAMKEHVYHDNMKKSIAEKFFAIFIDFPFNSGAQLTSVVKVICDRFNNLLPCVKDYLPEGNNFHDGLRGIKQLKYFFEKNNIEQEYNNMIDKWLLELGVK